MGDKEDFQHCTQKFIELANELKENGLGPPMISAALMSASGIYATYVAAGNEGGLNPSGVEKVVENYRRQLEYIQQRKRETAQEKKDAG